ncbi:Gfo/Idh/MocA family protein [Clostridium sp. 'White wine YQ']|uniref:Gfo/Idh/MocA family protein n=1 Tax=Clostridium sp. 'White wine YQ' TaxID=3027474 RepID=UPI0023663051|nr:Gfo/Idh/MocA family oxidoreductase [Clostridium sp. 'White wine YQ']MDD7794069.1 Gfo/Idh/MocA family oxidoreductase [Clostridium sp. 'White wine YQ']
MKIGIIGLGDIAKKGYLPVLSEKENIELVLCTRNKDTLSNLSKKYRISECASNVEELIKKGVEGVFVSTATEAHFEIAKKLLQNGIHVYIDKPISLNFNETQELVKIAEESKKIAMVGFNRRFAPMIKELKEHGKADIIIIQKNRFKQPDYTRRFIVEDFIHVVDTLRFLMDEEIKDINVRYLRKGDLLHNVIIELIGESCTAIGIMNRNNGVTEEVIEYMTEGDKYIVDNIIETIHFHDKEKEVLKFGDWEPTLFKRGFYQIVDHFIDCIEKNMIPNPSISDSLRTHEICEKIVMKIN